MHLRHWQPLGGVRVAGSVRFEWRLSQSEQCACTCSIVMCENAYGRTLSPAVTVEWVYALHTEISLRINRAHEYIAQLTGKAQGGVITVAASESITATVFATVDQGTYT